MVRRARHGIYSVNRDVIECLGIKFWWPGQLVVRVAKGHRKQAIPATVVSLGRRTFASCARCAPGQQVVRATKAIDIRRAGLHGKLVPKFPFGNTVAEAISIAAPVPPQQQKEGTQWKLRPTRAFPNRNLGTSRRVLRTRTKHVKVAVDLRATVPKATLSDRRPEVDGYLPRLLTE